MSYGAVSATLAQWTAANPTIPLGEMFYVSDTAEFGIGTGAAFLSTARCLADSGDPRVSSKVDTGCANQNRDIGVTSQLALVSGDLVLSYFKAPYSFTSANVAFYSGSTAAGATPTLVEYALFTVASNGDLTRVALTTSDTAIFAGANSRYPKAWQSSVPLVAGTLYATGLLLTTAAALPTVMSAPAVGVTPGALGFGPRLCGRIVGQAAIAASYAVGSVANSSTRAFAEITT